jgi:hypothetical protein
LKKPFIIIVLLAINIALHAQALRQPVSAVYIGLSAYSNQQVDAFGYTNNQAALAQIKNTTMGIYAENRFMLAATSMYAFTAAIPTTKGNFGINIKYAGFTNFNQSQVGLAYGRSLGKKVDIGIQFNYYGYKVPAYISDNALNVEIGAIVHVTDKLNAGVHIYNPIGGKFSKTADKLSTAIKVGVGYDASEKLFVSAELVKEEDFPVNINAGIQYQFVKQFFARLGLASANNTAYAGVGVAWSNIRLDISGSYHPQLGLSPGLLLLINLAKKNIAQATINNEQ